VLNSCLLNSPDLKSTAAIKLQRGYTSAAEALNSAIDQSETDLLIIVHQDVYLPAGWIKTVEAAIKDLTKNNTDWGVLGVWGGGVKQGNLFGYMYWTGVKGVAGKPFDGLIEASTLDEVVLILRKSSGLRFDPMIPGFHMYGTDICLEAGRRGMKCYAISAFCIHNTNQYGMLPWQYWNAYFKMRTKWKSYLPISSPCIDITYWCWPMVRWNLVRAINLLTGRDKLPAKRVEDPVKLYHEMVRSGTISPDGKPILVPEVSEPLK
jgi:hypothetical protein